MHKVRLECVAVAGLVLACASPVAGNGWREVAPLPAARFFHRAGADEEGRVYAFAGRVELRPGGPSTHGVDKRGLVVYDPVGNVWREGPPPPPVRTRVRLTARHKLGTKTLSSKIVEREREGTGHLEYEYPDGTSAGRRLYWFSGVCPVWFDTGSQAWGQSAVPLWDQDAGRWISSVNAWQRRNAVTAAGPDGRLYLVGGTGQNIRGFGPVRMPPDEIITLHNYVEIYDPATFTWSEGASMERARQLFAGTFGADGKLYVFGGFGHIGAVSQRPGESEADYDRRTREMMALSRRALRSVEAYDPATNTWSRRAPMPEGRHAMGAALGADGRIYVVGGAVSYSSPKPTDTVFVYDPRTDTWERGPSLNQGRYHHAVVAAPGGKIYAIGGTSGTRSGRGGPLASVEVLDTAARAPGQDLPPVGERIRGEASWVVASPER